MSSKRSKRNRRYYEILKIAPSASAKEIEDAYKSVRSLYGEDSVATYSLYTPEEREEMLRKVMEAYEVLKDPEKRKMYNSDKDKPAHGAISIEKNEDKPNVLANSPKPVGEANVEGSFPKTRIKKRLVTMNGSNPMATEQYRVLYTKIEQISTRDSQKVFAITSAVKGEGKTVTSLNLANVMANDFRKKTILVECDMKNTSISSSYLDVVQASGLVDVLNDKVRLDDVIARVSEKLYILPAIHTAKNSSELLSSHNMVKLIATLKNEFDYVLIDSPPILPLADVNILAKLVDGFIFVVRAGNTPKDVVAKAIDSISSSSIAGIVLNGVDATSDRYSRYSYHYQ